VEVVASLSQGRTAAAQCGLFTHKSVPVIFEPPCIWKFCTYYFALQFLHSSGIHNSFLYSTLFHHYCQHNKKKIVCKRF